MAEFPGGTVTFLMTDVEGSTKLWEESADAMRVALDRHDSLAETIISDNGGSLVKERGEGDSLFAVFQRASDAVIAALALQRAYVNESWPTPTPICVRMAINTGETDRRGGDYYGHTVNRCARLRAVAYGSQIVVSQSTEQLTRGSLPEGAALKGLGSPRLKDLSRADPVFQLLHPDLPAEFAALKDLDFLPNNLPQSLTNFIGREKEIEETKALLKKARLLTLTGSGGAGKTRLAIQVAADMLEGDGDGVWLVELAPLADPSLVVQTVASTLGVREEPGRPLMQTLTDYLKHKDLLLVLDNCEHLLTACSELADGILKYCPDVRILASSREGLGIAGETTYRIPSLSLPDSKTAPTADTLGEYEAVRLFVDRAQSAQPSFAMTDQNAAPIGQICVRLDGIPLAIELAAARVKAMSVEQLAARLDDRFRLLTGGSRTALPRQQTLRATIDWSYDLLSEKEQTLLRRLSVFAGGWTLEAAEKVCSDPVA